MRITEMDGFTLEDALLPDEADVTLADLRVAQLTLSDDPPDEGLGVRRLLEYPEDVGPSFHYAID